jgi:hypothetical protein
MTLSETLAEIRKHMATARFHLAKVDAMLEAEEEVILEDELAERGLVYEDSEPDTLRDSAYAYLGE